MQSGYRSVRERFIQLMETIAEERGFKGMHGRVLACLFLSDSPLNQQAIARWTGYSVSAISRVLEQLVALGSVRRSREPGSRSYNYQVGTSLSTLFVDAINRWSVVVERAETPIAELTQAAQRLDVEGLKKDERAEARQMVRQLVQLGEMLRRIKALFEKLVAQLRTLDHNKP
jgi:DNA-binding transcriptional regulator GbsR (MarR family)